VVIGDVPLHPMTFGAAVDWICARARSGLGGAFCTPNADYLVRAHRDPAWLTTLLATDVRVPDGMGVIYAAALAGRSLRGTVTGRLLLPAVAARAAREGWPIALFGAGPAVADGARQELQRRFPGLQVSASITPPMDFAVGSAADEAAVQALVSVRAPVIFVALGAPRQETWMVANRARLPDRVLVGVGAAFDIVSGRFREAPRWMTRLGLEWLFRLAQEPRRLARRYLIDDPWIFAWAVRARLSQRRATEAVE
jgi:N-acetylglucosaminyldiphosphoundecaprenol N-acetyl-beta-D-mannosaminyltransferase